jgi:hypothetical protein
MSISIRDIFTALAFGTIVCRSSNGATDGSQVGSHRPINGQIGLLERLYLLKQLCAST